MGQSSRAEHEWTALDLGISRLTPGRGRRGGGKLAPSTEDEAQPSDVTPQHHAPPTLDPLGGLKSLHHSDDTFRYSNLLEEHF
jgi:hypothetical protein